MKNYTIIKFSILLILAIFIQNIEAQKGYAWDKLGGGINNGAGCGSNSQIQASKYINGNLYVTEYTQQGGTVTIHRWNGNVWSQYPSFGRNGAYINIKDIELYRGELYVCGQIDSITGLRRGDTRRHLGIIKFNGTNWDSLQNYPEFSNFSNALYDRDSMSHTTKLQVYKHKLYFLVNHFVSTVYSIDSFANINRLYTSKFFPASITGLNITKNKLMFSGTMDSIGASKTSGIIFYNDSILSSTKTKSSNKIFGTYTRNDSQYVVITETNKLELWQNDSFLKDISDPVINYFNYTGITFYNQFIIATSNASIGNICYDTDSSKWYSLSSVFLSRNSKAIPTGINKAIVVDCSNFQGAGELVEGALVSGKIYQDRDSSCTFNSGDILIQNTLIVFDNGTLKFYAFSDKNGEYELSVTAGSYNVTYWLPNVSSTIAPCSTVSLTVVAGTTTLNTDLPIHPSTNKNLGVNISAFRGYRTRLGFTENYVLSGANYSLVNDSLVIKLKYPSQATFVSSDVTPFSNSFNELVYKFANLDWLDKKTINIEFKTTVGVSALGDTIKFSASVINSTGDSMIDNNYDTLVQKVIGAYDPNIKQCYPEGKVKPGLKKIKYTIHFQNTGNDTAYNVTIVDTITQKLGLRSLRVTNTSHSASYSLRVENNNILIWEFNNILLPDSHINEKASHGFISFEADINNPLAVGDSINNKAYIYFDYQNPIITNIASVVAVNPTTNIKVLKFKINEKLKLYPNPTNSFVKIEVDNKFNGKNVELYDILGKLIEVKKITETSAIFNVSNLAKGIYFIKIEGTEISNKLLVE